MQFHNCPPCGLQGRSQILCVSFISPVTMGADNTNPIEKFRLLGEKRERCCGGCSAHSQHSAWSGIESRDNAAPGIPQYENPDSSPFDIVPRSWEKLRFISDGFLCWKLHHLFIFWPLNAAANAKSFSIFERNYKFPFYLMSCKPWFGKISAENESRII